MSASRLLAVLSLVGALLLLPPLGAVAWADEAQRLEEAAALLEQLETARRAADRAAIDAALPKVPALHNALDDKPVRAKLQDAVGDVLDEDSLPVGTRLLAADTLGAMHDERVWTQLKREWPAANLEAALPLHIRLVESAGKVAAPASAASLIDLLRQGRDANLVRASVDALAEFGWAKNRVTVLQALGDTIPLTADGGRRGAEVARTLQELRPALLAALNRLTGRTEPTLESWAELLKTHKRKLDDLFQRERS
jgi:hypothetical protein